MPTRLPLDAEIPKDYVFVNLPFASLLRQLYGDKRFFKWEGMHRRKKFRDYKKVAIRVLRTIQTAARVNIPSRNVLQVRTINRIVDNGIESLTSAAHKEQLHIDFTRILIRLVFQVLGDQADNSNKNCTNGAANWRLNRLRSLDYSLSPDQKAQSIRTIIRIRNDEIAPELIENNRPLSNERLIEEFKLHHPQLYCEYF